MTFRRRYASKSNEYGYYNPTNQRLKDLKDELLTGEYAKKYKKGDKLLPEDIEDIAKSVVESFKDLYGQLKRKTILGQFSDDKNGNEQENLAEEYIKKILEDVKYGDKDFDKFVSSLTLNRGNQVPFSIGSKSYYDNPNILDNTAFYILNPDIDAQLRDKLKSRIQIERDTRKELEKDIDDRRKYLEGMEQEIDKMRKVLKQTEDEKVQVEKERDKARKGFQIAKDNVEGAAKKINDIHTLLTSDERKILDDVARKYGYDPSFKENLRKTREELKAPPYNLDDKQINYVITKASDDYAHMRKMMESNPDLFERDMSNDTIQKQNEQFQSKLRQQNLKYILPKFIERREKLVSNVLNPELLKGAFAI